MAIHRMDIAIIVIIMASTLFSLYRGFVKEVISFFTWIAALALARVFSPQLADALQPWIQTFAGRIALSSMLIFILVWFLGNAFSLLMNRFIADAGLGLLDRSIGTLFGFLRGCLAILLIVGVTNWLGWFSDTAWWKSSVILPYFLMLEDWTKMVVRDMY
jgi:membrane protein required for colicin V production